MLAPLLPLAAHTAVATVDPRKVIATVRGSEVAADPTNALALEASLRRSALPADDPRSGTPIRLAASQRATRAQQHSDAPGMLAHFQLFGLVTAGLDTGGHAFEHQHLAGLSGVSVVDDPDRSTGRGYYTGLCFKVHADVTGTNEGEGENEGEDLGIGDGGFVGWSRKLTGNHKERLLISGFGVERLVRPATATATADQNEDRAAPRR